MQNIPTCMVTIGRRSLHKQKVTGGERYEIDFFFSSKRQRRFSLTFNSLSFDRWKANRVFDQLEVTRYHTGLVLFLEEDHYVAEDFLYLLKLMQKKAYELCAKCNVMSLGTYLKTFNYYTYNSNHKKVSGNCFLI